MYSNSYAMLATQLNGMVAEKQLDDYCVVKVKRLQCNTMQGKKVIIILEMEILRPGSQVQFQPLGCYYSHEKAKIKWILNSLYP